MSDFTNYIVYGIIGSYGLGVVTGGVIVYHLLYEKLAKILKDDK